MGSSLCLNANAASTVPQGSQISSVPASVEIFFRDRLKGRQSQDCGCDFSAFFYLPEKFSSTIALRLKLLTISFNIDKK